MRKYDQVLKNFDLILHARPVDVARALLKGAIDDKSGPKQLHCEVCKRTSDTSSIAHWMLKYDSRVAIELVLMLDLDTELHGDEKIFAIRIQSINEHEQEEYLNIKRFQVQSDKVVRLELHQCEIILAPEKYGQTHMTMSGETSFGEVIEGENARVAKRQNAPSPF